MKSRRTRRFRALYRDLPANIQKLADKAYSRFKSNPDYPGLNFKSVGGDPVWYSVRIGISYRALCERADDGTYVWFWIGPHDEYDRVLSQR